MYQTFMTFPSAKLVALDPTSAARRSFFSVYSGWLLITYLSFVVYFSTSLIKLTTKEEQFFFMKP